MRLLVLTSALVIGTAHTATPAVVRVHPTRDNTLIESAGGDLSNGGGPAIFAGNNGQGVARRALLFFDVASLVPTGAVIDSALLTLHVSNAPDDFERQFTVHRVLAAWGEATSFATGGGGATAAEGDATWIHTFSPVRRWTSPGGDFVGETSASLAVAGLGTYTWRGEGLTTDVRSWLVRPATNHGWLVRGEEIGVNTARRFDSREAAEPAAIPTLTIYCTEKVPARSLTWGDIKTRYR
jgi:hypothetical protein